MEPDSKMSDPEAAVRIAIRETMATYAIALDDGDFESLANTFAEDGVFEVRSGLFRGRGVIQRALAERRKQRIANKASGVFQRHNLTTSQISVSNTAAATSITYFLVVTELGLDHSGRYFDSFIKVDDRWLISNRRSQIDWMHEQSRFRVNTGTASF